MGCKSRKLALIADESFRGKVLPPSDLMIYRPKTQGVEEALHQLRAWDLCDFKTGSTPLPALYFNHPEALDHYETLKNWVESTQEINTQEQHKFVFQRKRGLHLKQRLMVEEVVLKSEWVDLLRRCGFGTSLHSLEELKTLHLCLNQTGLMPDYLLLSNVFTTECKAGKTPIERSEMEAIIASIRDLASTSKTQIFLLGGIDEHNVHQLKAYEHDGVCVMSLVHFPERLKRLLKAVKGE